MTTIQEKITAMFDCGNSDEIKVDGADLLSIAEALASIAERIGDNRALGIIENMADKHADAIGSDRVSASMHEPA